MLNLVVVSVGFYEIATNPKTFAVWRGALGLSGFETGVSMMPLVRGEAEDDPERPAGRIRNTRKVLTVAALIMSFCLITTSFVIAGRALIRKTDD